ncbi:aminotransferase class I/II-fold pyridoxal phosphate-dependent enzyme [Leuconostoc suionicum]|uniref:aminotransferase class I/II-fold pyridoxal phosphate-dependent enzyme n=1 Tax=Leuconostoc suionicum TaxID=1511761 RepID=UPI0021A9EE29|nr:aminotransferase class I/II-fold pyridoxal phosphate-dependent enzyme [Leuconostoc suionicum]MCT4382167.1 aminotransferase class I/II-fold pyridoxal phosphate-dependent enzyme [Leuconostoc suionicum]MDC2816651.1 aminotransferase class I/II-fold pyridoxal phosphate-dependent enzyme [Leuconostoc suionicum]
MPEVKPSLLNNLNQHLKLVGPSAIRAFDMEVSEIPDIIKLTLGEPDFNVPDHIKQAAIRSIEANDSHYAASNGTIHLREAAAGFLADRYDIDYDPTNEIIVTIGATEAIYDTLTTILNPGDKIILPTPIFPLYIAVGLVDGAEPVFIDTSSNDFVLSPEMLKDAIAKHGDDIKAVVLNFPSNPTGVTYNDEQIKAIADVLRGTDIIVISDEIYSELSYENNHVSMAKYLPEQTILLNGVSKSHAMTGYRIGILAGPAQLVQKIAMIHQFATTTASNPAMAAAAEALGTEAGRQDTLVMKAEYLQRRDYVYDTMTQLGFKVAKPDGAFYIFAKIPAGYIQDDFAFARDLAQKNGLALIPGSSFGPGGEGYIRLSYAASIETLQKAMHRLTTYMEENGK